jgi:hypothetical protein
MLWQNMEGRQEVAVAEEGEAFLQATMSEAIAPLAERDYRQ